MKISPQEIDQREKDLIERMLNIEPCETPQDYNLCFEDGVSLFSEGEMESGFDEEEGAFCYINPCCEIMTYFDDTIEEGRTAYYNKYKPSYISYIVYDPLFENQEGGEVCYYNKETVKSKNIGKYLAD